MNAIPSNTAFDIDTLDVSDAELALVRKLRQKAQFQQLPVYRRQLLLRLKKLPLNPGETLDSNFVYKSYLLQRGVHIRYEKESKDSAENETKAKRLKDSNAAIVDPQSIGYAPGRTLTPLNDYEALMMDQDPDKFRPIDGIDSTKLGQESANLSQIESLLAQVEALKAGQNQVKIIELEAREKAIQLKEEELKKQSGKGVR